MVLESTKIKFTVLIGLHEFVKDGLFGLLCPVVPVANASVTILLMNCNINRSNFMFALFYSVSSKNFRDR